MTNFLQREFKSKPQVRGQFPERPMSEVQTIMIAVALTFRHGSGCLPRPNASWAQLGAREMRCEPTSAEPSPMEPSNFKAN